MKFQTEHCAWSDMGNVFSKWKIFIVLIVWRIGKKVWIFVIKFGNHTPFSACLVLVSLAPVHPLEKVQGTEQEQQKELQNVSSPDVSFFLFVAFVVVECTVFYLHRLEFNFLISCSFLLYTCSSTSRRLFIVRVDFFCLILLGQQHFRRITVCAIYFMNQSSILFLSFPFLLIISGFIIHHKKACSSKFPWSSFFIRVYKR